MRPTTLSSLVVALLVAASCARPAVDPAAEERTIRELDRRWVHTAIDRDTVKIAAFYAEDGEFLAPNAPRVRGRAAIRAAWAQLLRLPNVAIIFAPAKVWVSSAGDLAYETGPYRLTYDGPKGKRVEQPGKFVVTWRKVGGNWKVQYDIFNSDKPPAM